MYGIDLEAQDNNWNGEGLPKIGQMGIVPCYPDPVKIVHVGKHEIAFDSGDDGLDICKTYELKPILNPAEIAKQKAIDGLVKDIRANQAYCLNKLAEILVHKDYTNKVKPLSLTDFKLIYVKSKNFEDFYASLIRDGYCIGSADNE
jgi:hypothetical protein